MSPYFIKGLIIGFSVAAPVGPIGVLTIKRTLTEGRLSGFVTGIGAAGADTVYGFVAGFGLTAVSSFLLAYEFWLKLIGGVFLIYLGVKAFISKPQKEGSYNSTNSLFSNFSSTFLLTITNPATILSFLAIFAGLGLASEKTDYISSSWLVTGVFLGSAAWWLLLSSVVGFFNKKVSPQTMVWINRFSGVIIIAFGLLELYSCVVK